MVDALIHTASDSCSFVWLPPKIAEEVSGVHRKTLKRRGDAGQLSVRREGRDRRFRLDEMQALREHVEAA